MVDDWAAAGARADRLDLIASGDERAVSEFVARYGDRLYNFVYQRVGRRQEDAEDITYDTFLAATQAAVAFRGEASVFTWLCGIARRKIAGHFRAASRCSRAPRDRLIAMEDCRELRSETGDPYEIAERKESRVELVRRVVAGLRDAEAEVLILKYVMEMDVREIAQAIGRTAKAAESLLSRARDSFRRAYAEGLRRYEAGPQGAIAAAQGDER
jgi:RNA polymerase sigma-70 factor (ECF subfamily)